MRLYDWRELIADLRLMQDLWSSDAGGLPIAHPIAREGLDSQPQDIRMDQFLL